MCITISAVVEWLHNQIDEVDMVSPMSLKRVVSVSVVELPSGGFAKSGKCFESGGNWQPTS